MKKDRKPLWLVGDGQDGIKVGSRVQDHLPYPALEGRLLLVAIQAAAAVFHIGISPKISATSLLISAWYFVETPYHSLRNSWTKHVSSRFNGG